VKSFERSTAREVRGRCQKGGGKKGTSTVKGDSGKGRRTFNLSSVQKKRSTWLSSRARFDQIKRKEKELSFKNLKRVGRKEGTPGGSGTACHQGYEEPQREVEGYRK